jgi:hypothetical protein
VAHIRTRVVVGEEVNQPHAPFYDQDVLHPLGRRLQWFGIRLRHGDTGRCASGDESLQGGSVMIASKSPPHLQGFRVMSKVHRSKMRCRTPYWAAARMIPGCASGGNNSIGGSFGWQIISSRQPFPRICRPSMSEPNTSAPK